MGRNIRRPIDPHRFYGPSPWDVPHRLSLTFNYTVPDVTSSNGLVNRLAVAGV